MPTMQEKIAMIVSDFHPMTVSRESIYEAMLYKYSDIKITTFLTEFYKLVRKGAISKGDDNLYGLGANRVGKLDWLSDAREPIDEEKQIGE